MQSAEEVKKKRRVDKNAHRELLLEATANVILKHGFSGTTISRIQQESGLSRGMINLHFQSKDNLIRELALHMTQDYNAAWQKFSSQVSDRESTPENSAACLQALFETDFCEAVLNTRSARLTFAFRAEPDLRALGHGYTETRGTELHNQVRGCCRVLCTASGTQGDPEKVAMALMSLLEGLWTDFHAHPGDFSRKDAVEICQTTARAFFPGYF